jgi:NAD(P)H-dependent flavin oxidoreductase YrpB (nitropropane dioxygenase family)
VSLRTGVTELLGIEHPVVLGGMGRHRAAVAAGIARAAREDDAERGELNFGQSAGLIDGIESCAEVVRRVIVEAEVLISQAPGRFLSI